MQQELQEMVEEFQAFSGDSVLDVRPKLGVRGFQHFSFKDLARVVNENPASRTFWAYHHFNTPDTVTNKPYSRGEPSILKLTTSNPIIEEAHPVLRHLFPGGQMILHPDLYGELKGTEFVRLYAPDEESRRRSEEFLVPAVMYPLHERLTLEKLYELGATPLNVPLRYTDTGGRRAHEAKISGFLAALYGFDFESFADDEVNKAALTNLHALVDELIVAGERRSDIERPEERGIMKVRIMEFASSTPHMQYLSFGGLQGGSKGDVKAQYRLDTHQRVMGKRQVSPDKLTERLEKYPDVVFRAELGQPFTFHYVTHS